jgi:tRNA-dihydrouridine synthase
MSKQPFFVLAPMDDVTETVFRSIVSECAAPDYTMTEFVNVDGLCSVGKPRLMHKFDTTYDTVPVVAQIWGKTPEHFETVAKELAESGKFCEININFGCPEKTVVNNGCCSGTINNPDLAIEIIAATKRGAGSLPVSVKTRLGFNEVNMQWLETVLLQDITALTVHLRTRKEMSLVPAHWELMPDVVALRDRVAPQTKIIGNGDVHSRAQGLELAERTGCDGIMIGRGIFADPFAFAAVSPWLTLAPSAKIELYIKHLTLFSQLYTDRQRRPETIKKFMKVYISGFDGAAELRARIADSSSLQDAIEILQDYI